MSLMNNKFFISFAILLSMDTIVSNDLKLDQIVNLKNSGGIGCVLVIHTEVEKCRDRYTQRVERVVEKGFSMVSDAYRREYCCGFWSLRDCVADTVRHKCEGKSGKAIANMKLYSSEQENVLHKNCDGYDYGSKQCGRASSRAITLWTIIISFVTINVI